MIRAPKRGQHAVQIELNRALYVDEQTSEIKKSEFARLQQVLDQLLRKRLPQSIVIFDNQ